MEPHFPFGNTENPLTRERSMIFIVKGFYDELKKRGCQHGGEVLDEETAYFLKLSFFFNNRGLYNRATNLCTSRSRANQKRNV